ncbi:hypothetical protein D3C86_1827600 [compost metagenome]
MFGTVQSLLLKTHFSHRSSPVMAVCNIHRRYRLKSGNQLVQVPGFRYCPNPMPARIGKVEVKIWIQLHIFCNQPVDHLIRMIGNQYRIRIQSRLLQVVGQQFFPPFYGRFMFFYPSFQVILNVSQCPYSRLT